MFGRLAERHHGRFFRNRVIEMSAGLTTEARIPVAGDLEPTFVDSLPAGR